MSYVKGMQNFEKTKVNDDKNRKWKHKMIEMAFDSFIKRLRPDNGSYSIAAEEKSNLSFFVKINSFHHTLCKKKG